MLIYIHGYASTTKNSILDMAEKPMLIVDLTQNDNISAETSKSLPLQPLPRAVLYGGRSKGDRGGYDCEFVEPPPSGLQIECPVCLLVVKEPCIVSCCGHKFCRECIEPIEKDKKPCALCNEPDGFTFMRERALERSLKDLEVWCSFRKEGCEWKGKLGKLEEHLNRDPSAENWVNGCHFVAIECTHKCGEWFQRRHITTHETQQCKKRPYSCDYCRDYHSTFEDVIEVHYPQCSKYPVACPNDCGVFVLERPNVESHLKEHCPLAIVDCPFSYAGCETQLPRKNMPEHIKQNVIHLTLMATITQRLLKENQELQQKTVEREDELRKTVTAVQVSLQELNTKYNSVVKENKRLRSELNDKLKKNMETVDEKYRPLLAENQQVHSQAARKMRQGFKSLEDRLHDFQLKQDRLRASQVTENRKIDQKLQELVNKQQVTENELGALKEGAQKQKLEMQRLVCHPGLPIDFYVKHTDEDVHVYLPAFYTHGYRMCVSVDPNGYGDGEGTHVSIFTHMMQGPFDDYLKWPFRGEITIQIVNRVGDHDHVEEIIDYTDETSDDVAGRVTGKDRAKGWGEHQFLDHDELQYNAESKTQYLKDNTIHIRVINVTLS